MLNDPRYNLMNDISLQKKALFQKFTELSVMEIPNSLTL
jgi:hypothetical protein